MVPVRSADAMTSCQLPVHFLSTDSRPGQKTCLRLKLLSLENARHAFEEELLNFTKKACEEVQGFFSSSCPTGVFCDLAKALDAKCQTISKLSALLKDLAVDAVDLPPAIIQRAEMNAERPTPPLPPTQAIFPEISNPKPMKIAPLISWGCDDGVQVRHQKQTAPQLLRLLRLKAINGGSPEVTVMESNNNTYMWSSLQSASPTVKTQSHQFRQGGTDGLSYPEAGGTENQSPVFTVKREESKCSLTHTNVIAKTDLWDMENILTEVKLGGSDASPVVNKDLLQCPKPARKDNSAGAETPFISRTTIPQFQIRKFEEIEVVVSHIVSPDDFYVQHADSIGKLQALVTDSWIASSSYAEQNCIPHIGALVMVWFSKQEQWCRAQVTKICGVSADMKAINGVRRGKSLKVEAKRLDHGDIVCLPLWGIKELTPEMAALPLQAIQVSVANVTPVNGSDWSEEAVSWFKAMVYKRTFYARLYPEGPKVTVELFFEKGRLGAMRRSPPISVRLEQKGHAKQIPLRNGGLGKGGRK